jgi:hypothetical protein
MSENMQNEIRSVPLQAIPFQFTAGTPVEQSAIQSAIQEPIQVNMQAPMQDTLQRNETATDTDHGDWQNWLRLSLTPHLGLQTQHRLVTVFGSPAAVFTQSAAVLLAYLSEAQAKALQVYPPDWDTVLLPCTPVARVAVDGDLVVSNGASADLIVPDLKNRPSPVGVTWAAARHRELTVPPGGRSRSKDADIANRSDPDFRIDSRSNRRQK